MMATLTSLNRRTENVIVEAVIISELEFGNIQRHVFLADLVERADNAAFHNRPETLNRIGVNRTDDILMRGVADDAVREAVAKVSVPGMLVGANEADPIRNRFMHETIKRFGISAVDDAGNHVTLALHRADDGGFARAESASAAAAFIPMLVVPLAAKETFVNFNDPAKLGFRLNERGADFMAHGMRRAVAAEAHDALNLEGANSLLAGQHQMGNAEPVAERLIRVLKDGASNVRKAIAVNLASLALPVIARCQRVNLLIATARAANAIRPAPRDQVAAAIFLIGKRRFELSDGHLMDWLGAAHGVSSFVGGYNQC